MNKEQDTYSFWSIHIGSYAHHFFSAHTLVYLYGGQLYMRNQCGESLRIGRGDCAFIGRDSYSYLYAEQEADEPCQMLFFSLSRLFLCEFYQTLDTAYRVISEEPLSALHLLPHKPGTKSFFHSLFPYIKSGQGLSEEVLRLKMIETTYTLLATDKRYAPILFDFTGTCRMGLFDLLKKQTDMKILWRKLRNDLYNKLN